MEKNYRHRSGLESLTLSVFLALMIGYILVVGQEVLLPIFVAVILVYVLRATAAWLHAQPGFRALPRWCSSVVVVSGMVLLLVGLVSAVVSTAGQVQAAVPRYLDNLDKLFSSSMSALDFLGMSDWRAFAASMTQKVTPGVIFDNVLAPLGSLAGWTVTVLIYAAFMMGGTHRYAQSIAAAVPGMNSTSTSSIIQEINSSIGNYLSAKTMVNIVLAVCCYLVLSIAGVDFALFWAIFIGLLNYIPYVGSLLGVVFPVLLTLAQFGSVQATVVVAVLLTAIQVFTGNVVEPRLIGQKVRMSPLMVLISLTVWTALWGVAGAILAVPLTSILSIILAAFPATLPLAALITGMPLAQTDDEGDSECATQEQP